MNRYNWINRVTGFVVFCVAMVTYALTIEPTASFWDCPEFITTAFKMEVGHPPGAPFFMLTGKIFSLFASDPGHVAYMVNMMSAFLSALTILFLFFTITHMAKKVLAKADEAPSIAEALEIIGCGIIGALAYTFSDTFWFSAVEGEVYAYSSFLTALVFWLILKWEEKADEPYSDRFIILIFYIMGVSVGVHLLNLLTIPAIALVYYFKKYENPSFKGACIALLISFAILAFILYGIIPGFITLAGYIELFCVNTLGMPFNSGTIIYCVLALGSLIWAIFELYKKERNLTRIKISTLLTATILGIPFLGGSIWIGALLIIAAIVYFAVKGDKISTRLLSTIVVSMAVILIGYSSYAVIVVRSLANPPMDQNSPDNVFALKSYLNREQYGDRPLIYGPYYSASPLYDSKGYPKSKEKSHSYGKQEKITPEEPDEYVMTSTSQAYEYGPEVQTLFPRMHSSSGDHPKLYEDWINVTQDSIVYHNWEGHPEHYEMVRVPTFANNLAFFFTYQLNYMYFRYLMWNFSGRQNDIQGHGEVTQGNCKTGFNAIDKHLVGDQENLPPMYANNKGNNSYYMLPLLLALIGIVFQLASNKKGKESFWTTFIFFFMTGIAIVLYLNQGPNEPRERDYAYAGSFYAFAIWIGFGVAGLAKILSSLRVPEKLTGVLALLITLPVPAIMARENWDDHDRSGRYLVHDFALNYFNSCAPNAIIFTNGDNDTFPLWYTQDTEGDSVSLDKRVCNLSYLQTDWYIDQMRRDAYKSKGLPISWERKDYMEGTRDVVRLLGSKGEHDFEILSEKFGDYKAYQLMKLDTLDLKFALDQFLLSDNASLPDTRYGKDYFLPVRIFTVPIDSVGKDNLVKQGAITPDQKDSIADTMVIDLRNKSYLSKSDIMVLEMIANNNWERPIYYAITVGSDMYLGMKRYLQYEGMAYRIVPFKNTRDVTANTDIMYDNLMNKFRFGNIEDPSLYLDENSLRMCVAHRQTFSRLADNLIAKGKHEEAKRVIAHCMEHIPVSTVPDAYSLLPFVEYYYELGMTDEATQLGNKLVDDAVENLSWLEQFYCSPDEARFHPIKWDRYKSIVQDISINIAVLQDIRYTTASYSIENSNKEATALSEKSDNAFTKYMYLYQHLTNPSSASSTNAYY